MEAFKQTYHYLESYHASHGIMPTQDEIGKALGRSAGSAKYRLKRMKALGWLNYGGQQSIVLKGMK